MEDLPPLTAEQSLTEPNIHVSLTPSPLSPTTILSLVKSPQAGANVLFSGTTRATFASKSVAHLAYSAYVPLALRTLQTIAREIKEEFELIAIAITHRLGRVDVGEESVLIAVSAAHRQAAWRAGEECLERVKSRVEIWKEEHFEDGGGVWRSNRDGAMGVPVAGTVKETAGS